MINNFLMFGIIKYGVQSSTLSSSLQSTITHGSIWQIAYKSLLAKQATRAYWVNSFMAFWINSLLACWLNGQPKPTGLQV